MSFFEYIISPFIYFIEQVFLFSHSITGNYGLAIILLSFSVSLLLLPVFVYIEKSKKKDDVIKKKMQPLIDEVKRVYKGQERYYYIKTINRQHNYSSLKALIPILSLLIQIPFFIAAYQYLEHFEGLKAVSFLFIKDLSLPDGLFGIINILPILMTLVNLLTVHYYTKNGDGKESKQMLVIAIAFLVLLFNLPAGLVLYWTMNNVFSFLRLFITNPEVFKKKEGDYTFSIFISEYKQQIPKLKKSFYFILTALVISQLAWAFKYYFDDIAFRLFAAVMVSLGLTVISGLLMLIYKRNIAKVLALEVKPVVYFSLLFGAVYFYFASKFYFTGVNDRLALLGILFVIPTQFISFVYFYRRFKEKKTYKLWIPILSVLSLLEVLNLISIITGMAVDITWFNINIKITESIYIDSLLIGILFSSITSFFSIWNTKILNRNVGNNWSVYILSILYLTGFVFLWNPLITYATFPEAFDYFVIDILLNNFSSFILSFSLFIILYKIIPKQYKYIGIVIVLVLSIIFFINNTLIPLDLGSLQINKYSEESNLAAPLYKYLLEFIFILVAIIIVYRIVIKKKNSVINISLVLLNIILISQALYLAYGTDKLFNNTKEEGDLILNFSKTEKNIVFLMSDMFQGWAMDKIEKENPDVIKNMNGFVWYPNILSVSRVTNTTMPALIGGVEYTPDKLDKDTIHSNRHKMTDAMKSIIAEAHEKGYKVTTTKFPYTEMNEINADLILPYWDKKWDVFNKKLNITNKKKDGFSILIDNALMYSSPLFLKSIIYNNGDWLEWKDKENINKNSWISKKYNFLRLLPSISSTTSKGSRYIMLYSFVTHFPWNMVTEDGQLVENVSPTVSDAFTIKTFSKWIDWMKENGVYDNTKIIIVSDHGVHWHRYKGKIDINIPFILDKEKVKQEWMRNLNPLLLVKDFNSKGDYKKDWRMMSNHDVRSITFDENNPTVGEPKKHRELRGYIAYWDKNIDRMNQFFITYYFKVKDNVFDAKNWEKVKYTNGWAKQSIINKESQVISNKNNSDEKDIHKSVNYDAERKRIIRNIKNNKTWFEKIKKQAVFNKLSIDSMLVVSANYVIRENRKKSQNKVNRVVEQIKNNTSWLESVKKQAKERNLPLDSMLIRNASYYIKQQQKNKKK